MKAKKPTTDYNYVCLDYEDGGQVKFVHTFEEIVSMVGGWNGDDFEDGDLLTNGNFYVYDVKTGKEVDIYWRHKVSNVLEIEGVEYKL